MSTTAPRLVGHAFRTSPHPIFFEGGWGPDGLRAATTATTTMIMMSTTMTAAAAIPLPDKEVVFMEINKPVLENLYNTCQVSYLLG